MKRLIRLLPILIAALISPLSASLAWADAEPSPYTCDKGHRIDISFTQDAEGRALARLHFAEETLALPQVASAAEARYRQGDIRLSIQGEEIMLEDGQGNRRRCRQGTLPPASTTAPADTSSFITLSGTVHVAETPSRPARAALLIRVLDIRRTKALTLLEQRYELNGASGPIPILATLDRDLIGPRTQLMVEARIETRGQTRWAARQALRSAPAEMTDIIDLTLKPVRHAVR